MYAAEGHSAGRRQALEVLALRDLEAILFIGFFFSSDL